MFLKLNSKSALASILYYLITHVRKFSHSFSLILGASDKNYISTFLKLDSQLQKWFLLNVHWVLAHVTALDASSLSSTLLLLWFIESEFRGWWQKLHFDIFELVLSTPKVIFFLNLHWLLAHVTALDASSLSSALLLLPFIESEFRGLRQKLHFDISEIGLTTPKVIFF